MSPAPLSELLKLSEAERIQLAQDLWDSIPPDSPALPLPPELLLEIQERMAEHRANPASAIPAEDAFSWLTAHLSAEPVAGQFRGLDAVVLLRDIPEADLRAGDLGCVVGAYGMDGVEVEFVTGSGRPFALAGLAASDARTVGDDDLLAVRPTP